MDSDDASLFKKAMANVTPLRTSDKRHTYKKPPPAIPTRKKQPHPPQKKTVPSALSNPWDTSEIHANTCLSFGKERLQPKQFRALKQGHIRPQATLDLHGVYLDTAGDTLVHFIHASCGKNMRCVLIIHGKGGRFHEPPILKNHVNHWLKQLPEVLAFHSACPRDGGYGAVYVLLRRLEK
ncbi:MAG: Smr/MutS family protein [Legionellaceae bacterium]|nr:Smr/MutS family protein [Legionellaceae bacterium]